MKLKWEFYLTGKEAQDAMLRACQKAYASIDLEQYIFEDDELGREFVAVLIKKAQEGVRVRVLCDMFGSQTLYSSYISDQMRAAGIALEFFNPIEPWWLYRTVQWFLRDHRKFLIIDGEKGYTGGVGISKDLAQWRDTHVMITGEVVLQMQLAFERIWHMTRRQKRFFKFAKPPEVTGSISLMTNAPLRRQRFIYYAILDAIKNAKHHIYITTPYFVPNTTLLEALKRAVRRGVEVYCVFPKKVNHSIVGLAGESHYWSLLRAGVRIFLYEPAMIHAKTLVVDESWATVGTSNLDNISLLLNYEDNLVATEPKFVAALTSHFRDDLKVSKELTQEAWHDRPMGYKTLELLTWPLHKLL